jgi:cytochrome c-type biogenesis protein
MDAKLALAFSAGMVATVNPCGFALLPAYLSYFLGMEGEAEANDAAGASTGATGRGAGRRSPVLRALSVSGAVTAGFLVVFGVMGLIWSSVSEVIGQRLPYFTIVVGIGLVVVGIAMSSGSASWSSASPCCGASNPSSASRTSTSTAPGESSRRCSCTGSRTPSPR